MKVAGATTGLRLQSSTTYLGVVAWVPAVAGMPELARAAAPPPAVMMPAPAKIATARRVLVFNCVPPVESGPLWRPGWTLAVTAANHQDAGSCGMVMGRAS